MRLRNQISTYNCVGNPSRTDCHTIADPAEQQDAARLCSGVLGRDAVPVDITEGVTYSPVRHEQFRERSIVCETDRGRFLVRVNRATGAIFGVNWLTLPREDFDHPPATTISRDAAIRCAEEAMHLVGITAQSVVLLDTHADPDRSGFRREWILTYGQRSNPDPTRRIKVVLDGPTGQLISLWNSADMH